MYLGPFPAEFDEAGETQCERLEVLILLLMMTPNRQAKALGELSAAGLEPLYGSDTDLCGKVRGAISAAGQKASVGFAGGKFAAEVAARIIGEGEVNVIAVDDRKYLAGQGVDLLPLPEKALAQLRLLGIQTMSEFAALPRNSIHRRRR